MHTCVPISFGLFYLLDSSPDTSCSVFSSQSNVESIVTVEAI